jgi:hypothetical protein
LQNLTGFFFYTPAQRPWRKSMGFIRWQQLR